MPRFFFAQCVAHHTRFQGFIGRRYRPIYARQSNGRPAKPDVVPLEKSYSDWLHEVLDEQNVEIHLISKGVITDQELLLKMSTGQYLDRLLAMIQTTPKE